MPRLSSGMRGLQGETRKRGLVWDVFAPGEGCGTGEGEGLP